MEPMNHRPDWPDPVTEHLRRAYGEPLAVERLSGMSVARVERARFPATSVIVKSSPRPAESIFYERIADRLRPAGVPIPRLEWVAHLPDAHWLIIEDIPTPLPVSPLDRWQPDSGVVAVLTRLHRVTRDWSLDFPPSAARAWTADATDIALSCFPAAVATELTPVLQALQQEATHVGEGWCWISGDASPPNWGLRHNGELVLYDWELFRRGLPASDLAPTVPGLGDPGKFRRAAALYLEEWRAMGDPLPWSLDALARDIALAKIGTVVMLLRASADGTARVPDDYVARLVEAVPPWLRGLSRAAP